MSYQSILVHLDTGTHAQSRLELALQLAQRFHAKLTGVLSTYTPDKHERHGQLLHRARAATTGAVRRP